MSTGPTSAVRCSENFRLIGHSDQGGLPDRVQVMVAKGHAFIGHVFSGGVSVLDVRNPHEPKPVNFLPTPQVKRQLAIFREEAASVGRVVTDADVRTDPRRRSCRRT